MVVDGWKSGEYGNLPLDYTIEESLEQFCAIFLDGSIRSLGAHGYSKGNAGEARVPKPYGLVGTIHTHPDRAFLKPPDQDYVGQNDVRNPVPLYGVARKGVWVIRPGSRQAEGLAGQHPLRIF
ncbi:MAG: hypothetical protein DHS20C05_12570 [Hyphococcus sp.]|nr:MAG: hypothetical protein DHS20C05_12570 [Marinicaulis sp.]